MKTDTARTVREVRHQDESVSWRFLRASPAPELAAHVLGYTDYEERAAEPVRRRELPETGIVIVLNLGEPLAIEDPRDPTTRHTFGSAFVAGLSDTYTLTETAGTQAGVQVNLTPRAARRIFGVPMHELTNRVIPLDDVFGRRATDELLERLAEAPRGEARWRLLDAALAGRVERGRGGKGHGSDREVGWALGELEASLGRLPVGRLSATLGWSRKRLVEAFREEVGLAPKLLARLFRFHHALELLDTGPVQRPEWSRIAYACGYSDQSHMIRDFQQFTGMPPSTFARHRLPGEGGVSDG